VLLKVIELLLILSYSLLCVWEWMSRCVCLKREMCVLIIHIYIFTHMQDWEMWELCLFSILLKVIELLLILSYYLLCVWMNEWMSWCVYLEREMCVLIIHIYIYLLTFKIERCESCVCFQCFWKWLSSFWSYLIPCCVCENEWVDVCV
jgi:hypothetical protein